MTLGFVLFFLILSYIFGQHNGRSKTLKSFLGKGIIVEFRKDFYYKKLDKSKVLIPVGVQAIIMNKDKWGRFSLKIFEPWKSSLNLPKELYFFDEIDKVRVLRPTTDNLNILIGTIRDK